MARRIGIRISRAFGDAVVLDIQRGRPSILHEAHVERAAGSLPQETLSILLRALSPSYRGLPASVALSSGDLACADLCIDPPQVKRSDLDKIVPGLCEAQTLGKSAEGLSMDAVPEGTRLEMAAIDTEVLKGLLLVAREGGYRLTLVTSSSMALSHTVPVGTSLELRYGRERISIESGEAGVSWRSLPDDHEGEEECPAKCPMFGLDLSSAQVLPVAVALADPDRLPNLLRGAPDAPRTFAHRMRGTLSALGIAAGLVLGAVGLFFQTEAGRYEEAILRAETKERELWSTYFPDRQAIPGLLVRSMKEHVLDTGGAPGIGDYPSALHFWAEFGAHLPDADTTGLVLESLDLSPEGGRLSAKVAVVQGDPLKYATLLEGQLNESGTLSARGDYERRGTEIQVRLRMDFREGDK